MNVFQLQYPHFVPCTRQSLRRMRRKPSHIIIRTRSYDSNVATVSHLARRWSCMKPLCGLARPCESRVAVSQLPAAPLLCRLSGMHVLVTQSNHCGQRIDQLNTSEAWNFGLGAKSPVLQGRHSRYLLLPKAWRVLCPGIYQIAYTRRGFACGRPSSISSRYQ